MNAQQTDATTTDSTAPVYYCRVCGTVADSFVQVIDFKTLHREFVCITCRNEQCTVCHQTLSLEADLSRFNETEKYSISTGAKVNS